MGLMGKPFKAIGVVVALASAVAVSSLLAVPSAAQTPSRTYKAPRLAGTTNPNLRDWQALTKELGLQVHAAQPGPPQFGALFAQPWVNSDGNEIPYQPGTGKKKENFENGWFESSMTHTDDTSGPGSQVLSSRVPRATHMPFRSRLFRATKNYHRL
jgi:hypothetical protein